MKYTRPEMMGTLTVDPEPGLVQRSFRCLGRALMVAAIVLAGGIAAYINPQAFVTGFTVGYVATSISTPPRR